MKSIQLLTALFAIAIANVAFAEETTEAPRELTVDLTDVKPISVQSVLPTLAFTISRLPPVVHDLTAAPASFAQSGRGSSATFAYRVQKPRQTRPARTFTVYPRLDAVVPSLLR